MTWMKQKRNDFKQCLAERKYKRHNSKQESPCAQIAQRIKATRTLLVGLSHSFGDHEENNRELRERPDLHGLDIQLAFDGQSIKLDL